MYEQVGQVDRQKQMLLVVMKLVGMECLGLREFRGEQDVFFR